MNTVKLYQKDVYLRENTAILIDAVKEKDGFSLILDQTVFFPTGGGQSCDKGKINNLEVADVYEKDGIVYHIVQGNNSNIVWTPGQEVSCTIDWEHRFSNMQRHCGEHILSGIFFREYGGVNRGFHMGGDYMTIDISLELNPEISVLTWDMAVKAELLANRVIWSDAPVTVRCFESRSEAAKLPLRKDLTIDEDISVVCVGNEDNPADCVACCGTHPSSAGQVGIIKILKVENYKGMFRVYCEAGSKALELFQKSHEIISKLNNKYSASTDDLLEKAAAQDEKNKAVRSELHLLKQSVINIRTDSLKTELQSFSNDKAPLFVKEFSDLKVDDLLNIGRPLIPELDRLLLIVSRPGNTILLFSKGTPDCGKLVKENASIYQGKGGGNANSARAIFPKEEYIDTFIDLLNKHLHTS